VNLPAAIGRYLPIRLLGHTDLGAVYLAKDPRLGREVAVKVASDEAGGEEREPFEERLREEGERVATLSHPHIATLLDAGEDDALGPFLVFEHAAVPTLRERMAEGPLSSAHVSRLARELGAALTHIHDAGLVHRSVTPGSVWITPSGAKLRDFGRLAPPSPDADAYTDESALAAMLYEALAGHPRSAAPGTHDAGVEPRVLSVFSRATHPDKAQRFLSCRAFGEALAASIQDSPSLLGLPLVSLPPDSTPVRLSTVPRATRKAQNMLAGGALAVILLLFFYGRHPAAVPDASLPPKKPPIDAPVAASPAHPRERKKETTAAESKPAGARPTDNDATERDE
jgi:serine/threonine protein kinase